MKKITIVIAMLLVLTGLKVQARTPYDQAKASDEQAKAANDGSFNAAPGPVFSVANTIQSKMVIQQDRPLTLWGKGRAGTTINIRADWMRSSQLVTCDGQSEWKTEIKVPKAEKGKYGQHTITLISSRDTLVLSDVLIGEVWVCGGQSNMDMTIKPFLPWLKGALDFEKEIAAADYPAIRLFDVRTDFTATPQDDCQGFWKVCSPVTAGDFSATAYFFARELWSKLHIPIGLVVSSVGGSSCQAWASRETLAADPALNQKYLYPYDTSARSREKLDSVVTFEKVVRPTLFYNVLANTVGARAPKPDGYIYVYGVKGKLKELLVARVPDAKFEDFTAWRFWDGKNWQPDINKCAALTNRVSNEMSVSFMEDGRVIAVYQLDTNSPDLMVQVGKTPEGPFALAKKIGATPEIYEDIDFYTYNAKAHPHLSKPGELLISYNVNSFDFEEDIKSHPHHLRPRFVTIKYK